MWTQPSGKTEWNSDLFSASSPSHYFLPTSKAEKETLARVESNIHEVSQTPPFFLLQKHLFQLPFRGARFFLLQHTKKWKTIPNGHKIYQLAVNIPNGGKML
jgi:hypothetical protein